MRRKKTTKREIASDLKYNDKRLAKFINNVMKGGKKFVAQRVVYNALEIVKSKTKQKILWKFLTKRWIMLLLY